MTSSNPCVSGSFSSGRMSRPCVFHGTVTPAVRQNRSTRVGRVHRMTANLSLGHVTGPADNQRRGNRRVVRRHLLCEAVFAESVSPGRRNTRRACFPIGPTLLALPALGRPLRRRPSVAFVDLLNPGVNDLARLARRRNSPSPDFPGSSSCRPCRPGLVSRPACLLQVCRFVGPADRGCRYRHGRFRLVPCKLALVAFGGRRRAVNRRRSRARGTTACPCRDACP